MPLRGSGAHGLAFLTFAHSHVPTSEVLLIALWRPQEVRSIQGNPFHFRDFLSQGPHRRMAVTLQPESYNAAHSNGEGP